MEKLCEKMREMPSADKLERKLRCKERGETMLDGKGSERLRG